MPHPLLDRSLTSLRRALDAVMPPMTAEWQTLVVDADAPPVVAAVSGGDATFAAPLPAASLDAPPLWRPDPPQAYCHRCGADAGAGSVTAEGCGMCTGHRIAWDRIVRLGPYEPPLSQWVVAMKYQRSWAWATPLGTALGRCIAAVGADPSAPTLLCPVPIHLLRRLHRGYNQSELLARAVARQTGWPVLPLLRRRRYRRSQSRMHHDQRIGNVRGAFAAANVDLRGWHVWLIDDVRTSGATAAQCASLLRKRRPASINLAVLAVAGPSHWRRASSANPAAGDAP